MRSVRRLVTLSVVGLALSLGASPATAASATAWTWPLAGAPQVVHGFAPPAEPWLAGHRGVDLVGRRGEPVRAAGAGVVHFAGRIGRVGIVSVLHADGLLTTYEPLRTLVRVGATVRRGQVLGLLVRAGSHCTPLVCLHWGLRRGPAYLDPLSLVGAGKVRLYPLRGGSNPVPAPPVAITALATAGLLQSRWSASLPRS